MRCCVWDDWGFDNVFMPHNDKWHPPGGSLTLKWGAGENTEPQHTAVSGCTGAGQRGTACTRTKTLKTRMNTQLQSTHTQTHRSANTEYKTNVKEGERGKMQEQLASRRGIREQKRICWRAKPAATAEGLYKQPIKLSAQVGTISPSNNITSLCLPARCCCPGKTGLWLFSH